ncbi:MAG TPA: hypothetical protein VGK88_04560 [bacterium]|jgi:hypothetical protein
MIKKLMTALLVAAMLLAATSISWGGNGNGKPSDPVLSGGGGFTITGATWE